MTVPADAVHILPAGVGLDVGALVEPLAVGWHAVERSSMGKGDKVLVVGGGPIGIAVILAARARGCGLVVVSEPSKERGRFAKEFGADVVLDPAKEKEFVARARELAGGEGFG